MPSRLKCLSDISSGCRNVERIAFVLIKRDLSICFKTNAVLEMNQLPPITAQLGETHLKWRLIIRATANQALGAPFQLMIAQLLTAVYMVVMVIVIIGMALQFAEEGLESPSAIFFLATMGSFVVTGKLEVET